MGNMLNDNAALKADPMPKGKPARKRKWDHEGRWGLLMASPYLLHFIIFVAGPLAASLYFSFSDYDMLNPPEWSGLDNFRRMAGDSMFWRSLWNTLYFAVLFVPLQTFLALVLAVALNQRLKGLKWFRMAHFIPVISSWTVILYVADAVFNPRFGLANTLLAKLGLAGQGWLQDPKLAIPLLVFIAVWKGIGYIMVIYLAGLQSVPGDLYEAAEIDGAGALRKFRYITVPLISPTTFLVVIMSTISTFQAFEQIYVLTGRGDISSAGGPNNSSLVMMLYLYREGFTFMRMGYASAIAWVLFMILFLLTLVQLRAQKKWVHYD
ncbi:binding-protein-dependent transport systems inner membrane component [Paenibacillus vortex V453]|jgi:multiple sugar transport system permease protein|uniref:ABC transporter permease n=2 Tax=Paenibacillus TaxID=44249 RepID=A0A163KGP8_9BACL|nr:MULTISPECIES: sugar ABC transporter permease [Paenibacillus]ANA81154.1 ABC transporter permease [Paenibacillus glucanolyticus]AVV54728.1 sugar ABC transporter permease [Paenibacillus glucanolyticus]AWP29375.1 ABC transporter permease [Paenibacillus sp. Cedars]EFU42233.1 binding-protein-dependent transport systems inner membrane component [Paenibacillus vortex V453]ETT35927.1 binding-protein-dependent transport systems inner membrane component [Paenibacillus sp. FSL R5-808]